ncbi:Wzz/FepE/Etk N-terminal domain-containing protein [Desulfolithobacter sp.]
MSEAPKEKEIIYAYPPFHMEGGQEDEINLLELWRILWAGKWFVVFFTLCCTLAAVFVSLRIPPEYKSYATLVPNQQNKSAASSLSGLIGNLPLPIALPGQGPSNIMSFLQSRTLKERLIKKYDLLQVLYKDIWDPQTRSWLVEDPKNKPTVIKALQGKVLDNLFTVNQDKKTELINIAWVGEDPAFCARMLERVIGELNFFLDNEYVSNARREREFVEQQLAEATRELEYWERQVPSEQLTLSKITRERLASQAVYTELRKQLELAKITEAKQLETFKVLDAPFVPERPFKPNKRMIVLLAFVASGFFAVFLVFFRNALRNMKQKETSGGEA